MIKSSGNLNLTPCHAECASFRTKWLENLNKKFETYSKTTINIHRAIVGSAIGTTANITSNGTD